MWRNELEASDHRGMSFLSGKEYCTIAWACQIWVCWFPSFSSLLKCFYHYSSHSIVNISKGTLTDVKYIFPNLSCNNSLVHHNLSRSKKWVQTLKARLLNMRLKLKFIQSYKCQIILQTHKPDVYLLHVHIPSQGSVFTVLSVLFQVVQAGLS